MQRNGDRLAVRCRDSGWSVSGRRSTAMKHTKTTQQSHNAQTASLIAVSGFEASSTEALCSSGRFWQPLTKIVWPCLVSLDRAPKQTTLTHNVDTITALFAKGGSGFTVQPCPRRTARLISLPSGSCDVQTLQIKLPRSFYDMAVYSWNGL
jgi:hypothetical protein